MSKRPERRRGIETIRFKADSVQDYARITRRFASLLVVQGADADIGAHVVCERPISIGRDPDAELPLNDASISRMHCRIERREDGVYLLNDLGSTNGTRLNGAKVEEPVQLGEGDKIFLGSTVVKFSFVDDFDVDYQTRVETLVATDPLTGLLTTRKFDSEFALAIQRSRNESVPISVLVMDMDGLKQINDAHGHQMGGFAITEVAAILHDVMAGTGETCRFGGDEFMSFLAGHDKERAAVVAERVRDAVASHVFEKDGVRIAPTISIGVASFPEDGDTTDDLFRAADRALYRAKTAGRNQVSF